MTETTPAGLANARIMGVGYDPTRTTMCAGCGAPTGAVHPVLDDNPVCSNCIESTTWSPWQYHLGLLDALDDLLTVAPESHSVMVLDDVLRTAFRIADARVPAGRDELLPDRVLIDELTRRRPDEVTPETMYDLVRTFAPKASIEDLARCREVARHRAAREAAEISSAEVAMLLLARTAAPKTTTMRDAIAELGIDYDRFSGSVVAAAAEQGCRPAVLAWDVVSDCIAAARVASA